jgi:hypothetical protein
VVELFVANEEVAGSSPVSRSKIAQPQGWAIFPPSTINYKPSTKNDGWPILVDG